jgi:hypothetical protein
MHLLIAKAQLRILRRDNTAVPLSYGSRASLPLRGGKDAEAEKVLSSLDGMINMSPLRQQIDKMKRERKSGTKSV